MEPSTIVLYCHNDGCSVKSERYEGEFPPRKCIECGSTLHDRPIRRDTIRPFRTYDSY
jgi:hypothetical protein